jgi:hypothetical protein
VSPKAAVDAILFCLPYSILLAWKISDSSWWCRCVIGSGENWVRIVVPIWLIQFPVINYTIIIWIWQ